jgi:hypothetical protein
MTGEVKMSGEVSSLSEAYDIYVGDHEDDETVMQPASDLSEYDEELGGWVFRNIRGVLALVKDDGTVVYPVYDSEEAEWVLPDEPNL